ncbi:NAD(P)-binding protein [Russula vinacea]|nr:NAD(P)-binding protein [Russula vinacea]
MGGILSVAQQSFPPHPTWAVDDIPDLTGKVAIVTGSNVGVGKETVKELLKRNAKVYLAARNATKANTAISELKVETGKEASSCNLTSRTYLPKEAQLHILINNAGVMIPPVEEITVQKYDMQFGTNVVGHWLFTKLLLPALLAVTDASPTREKARVVTVSSGATITDGSKRRKYDPWNLYFKSKLWGDVVVARELARRHGDKIVSTSVNPGNLDTDLQRHMPKWQYAIIRHLLYPASYGSLTQLYCATSPAAEDANGKFFIPWARLGKANSVAEDPKLGEKLWMWLEEETEKHR